MKLQTHTGLDKYVRSLRSGNEQKDIRMKPYNKKQRKKHERIKSLIMDMVVHHNENIRRGRGATLISVRFGDYPYGAITLTANIRGPRIEKSFFPSGPIDDIAAEVDSEIKGLVDRVDTLDHYYSEPLKRFDEKFAAPLQQEIEAIVKEQNSSLKVSYEPNEAYGPQYFPVTLTNERGEQAFIALEKRAVMLDMEVFLFAREIAWTLMGRLDRGETDE